MSKFLAPIHFWLYNKIEIQEELIKGLLEKSGADKDAFYKEKGSLPEGSLEDHIDTGNIHGWLQGQIEESEKRLAKAVAIAKEKGLADEDLEEIFYNEGTNREASSSPEEVYQKVNDSCLDGMPCDRVNALIDNTSDSVQWERTIDLHGEFFEEEGLNRELYYQLRDAYIKGLAGENLEYSRNDNQYTVRRKNV